MCNYFNNIYIIWCLLFVFILLLFKEINRSNRRIIKQTFNSDVLEIPEHQNVQQTTSIKCNSTILPTPIVDPENDDWDNMFDDNGDCLDPKLLDELTAAVGKVTIEKPKTDYRVSTICENNHRSKDH